MRTILQDDLGWHCFTAQTITASETIFSTLETAGSGFFALAGAFSCFDVSIRRHDDGGDDLVPR